MALREKIELLYDKDNQSIDRKEGLQAFNELKFFLNHGEVRAASPSPNGWIIHQWVKKGILLGFRLGELVDDSINEQFRYFDKSTYPLKKFTKDDNVRIVPGGTSIRDGCYVANSVVIMPPSYINVGAYVDEGTLVDSHVLVGSCAQIGKRVHLSAGSQIGGVLEPIGAMPVIIEDDVFVGGMCGIFEGVQIQRNTVLASGVIITASTPVYDLVQNTVYRSTETTPLTIPEGAVVVPGSRSVEKDFAQKHGISMYTPVIVKYRDSRTDARTVLETALR
ncbi:MAG: 2,3,4,5-tetrahydropyridine-2,6-dicarboxylate N-succinyltransferase [Bacteroidetes bacterium]|nr:2,3,4,5-tetrahydropyridine-2,6-dicarboxylate N-succinyltransferase [Bacteroidota bacterium]